MSTRPALQTTRPVVQMARPVVQMARPAVQTSRPAVQTSRPAAQTSRPAAQTTRPTAQTSLRGLADSISMALKQNDIPRAMHLSWLLMMQPHCPLQLQSHAVLVHSVASLTLGGDTEIIESNLQAMIKRLGSVRTKSSTRGEAPWHIQALGQLRGVWSALHSSHKANMYRNHSSDTIRLRDLDSLVEGFGKMDLGCMHGGTQWH